MRFLGSASATANRNPPSRPHRRANLQRVFLRPLNQSRNPSHTHRIEYPEGEPSNPALSADPVPPICDHQQLIRNEAIRLAAIACGRALRHVAVVHPQTLANFVDDALVAAGRPTPHSISTHQSDANLEFGEVVIESEGSRVEADIETRAKLLVRAAAEC